MKLILLLFVFTILNVKAGVFEDYAKGDFKNLKKTLLSDNYNNMDSSAKEAVLKISLDVFSYEKDFSKKEFKDVLSTLKSESNTQYLNHYLDNLIKEIDNNELEVKANNIKFLEPFLKDIEEKKPKGFDVDHKFNAQLDLVAAYCHRLFKKNKKSDYLYFQGLSNYLRGKGTHYLKEYLKHPQNKKYFKQAKALTKGN